MPMTTQDPEPLTLEVSVIEPAAVVTCTLRVLPANVAATCGGSGLTPISYSSRSFLISLRRQVHSAFVVMSAPSCFANGLGRLALSPPYAPAATSQHAPVFSG